MSGLFRNVFNRYRRNKKKLLDGGLGVGFEDLVFGFFFAILLVGGVGLVSFLEGYFYFWLGFWFSSFCGEVDVGMCYVFM